MRTLFLTFQLAELIFQLSSTTRNDNPERSEFAQIQVRKFVTNGKYRVYGKKYLILYILENKNFNLS